MLEKTALALTLLILLWPLAPLRAETSRHSSAGAMAILPAKVNIIRCVTPTERSHVCHTQNFCCGLADKQLSRLDEKAGQNKDQTNPVIAARETARDIARDKEGENWE